MESPDMERCRLTVETADAVCYLMDSCCTPGQQAQREQALRRIHRQAALREARRTAD